LKQGVAGDKRRWSGLRHTGEFLGLRLVRLMLLSMPLDMASGVMGWAWRLIAPHLHRHERVLAQLAQAYPDKPRAFHEKIALDMWRNLGRVFAESLMIERIIRHGRITVRDGEVLATHLATGKGTVFVSLHSGNWELAITPAMASGYKAAGIYQRIKNPLVDAWVLAGRRGLYPRGLFAKGSDIGRRLMRVVREGGAVAMLADLRDRRGAYVPFFGRPAPSSIFPALLCRTGDATLIAARVIRTKGVHFVIEVERVAVPQTQDRDADIIEATASIQALFEKWIREHPEQWMWSHRRWG